MAKYRKKPIIIEAIQLPNGRDPTDDEVTNAQKFLESADWYSDYDNGIAINTLEGTMRANPGDWIIKGVKGEIYPCKPDIFAATYEAV